MLNDNKEKIMIMENKKCTFAHICAYLSLAISVTMLVLWCCNIKGFSVVSLDSFVGVIVALLAIIVTVAIAWQIFNSIELKDKIKELEIMKDQFDQQRIVIEEQKNNLNSLIYASLAEVAISREDYMGTFYYSIKSLQFSMSLDKPNNIEALLSRMNVSVSNIKKGTLLFFGDMHLFHHYDRNIREFKLYYMIESQYEKIYNEFISKVKITDDKQ